MPTTIPISIRLAEPHADCGFASFAFSLLKFYLVLGSVLVGSVTIGQHFGMYPGMSVRAALVQSAGWLPSADQPIPPMM